MQRRRPPPRSDHLNASAHGGRWKLMKPSDEESTFTEMAAVGGESGVFVDDEQRGIWEFER